MMVSLTLCRADRLSRHCCTVMLVGLVTHKHAAQMMPAKAGKPV